MHGLFLHLFAYGFVSMSIWGVRKWPKKSEEKQKYKLHKTLNPLGRKAFRGASFSATKHIGLQWIATAGLFILFVPFFRGG